MYGEGINVAVRGPLTMVLLLVAICVLQSCPPANGHLRHHRGDSYLGGAHCSRCAPGWGVVERCGRGRDTRCAECQPGTYSPHHGSQPCWICSRCGPGLYEARRCTASADTVCDSCRRRGRHNGGGGGEDVEDDDDVEDNEDYARKCRGSEARSALGLGVFLAPEDARDTGGESELVNEDHGGEEDGEVEGEVVEQQEDKVEEEEARRAEERERERVLWEDARAQMRENEAEMGRGGGGDGGVGVDEDENDNKVKRAE